MQEDFKRHCEEMSQRVISGISGIEGTREGARIVCQGADGTATKLIDKIAEDIVFDYIRENNLCRYAVSEEAGIYDFGSGEGRIFLDPIDGTHNAVTGNPFYALSVAYEYEGEITHAFVKDLAHGELFYASEETGAEVDGRRVSVSDTDLLEKATLSIYGRKFDPSSIEKLGKKVRRWRLYGASALELCYVGAGRLDGFVDVRDTLRVTDAAAGMYFCKCAGGVVTGRTGGPVNFSDDVSDGRCLVATNGCIHNKVIEYLR
ncbi:bifunctional fructose-bisphosphatase/inositol-phosphate phosphatase [Methanoplanus limicola]|uniref:fructose-bisphosphatase n=1 Tax=Methanoplanus limicola DSM 2279 TaxID=937775 RepID=H1YYC2_9EURY|nr:bifunctional fructose-bisphosphatase/inositol-phosphate phosphatase [Methanoplanus limicola]EHQ34217.1 D-fructose 1,6-bisphosphatase [Methanoplanus limicola DSM 2279]